MRVIDLQDVHALARRALAAGGRRVSAIRVEWDIAGRCQKPYPTIVRGKPRRTQTSKWVAVKRGSALPMEVLIETPCRKCEACLKARKALWTARAVSETRASVRTWFGTLTLSSEHHHLALIRAYAKESKQGVDLAHLSGDEQFRLRHNSISPEITKYLKRVRASAEAEHGVLLPMRYLCVLEAHRSGLPHYHLLVHEINPDIPIRHKVLSSQWTMGFTNFKLVDVTDLRPVIYACEYLAKEARARVRASGDYGNPALRIVGDRS